MSSSSPAGYRTVSRHDAAEVLVDLSTGHHGLFALRSFQPGDILSDFSAGIITATPTYLTVQIGHRRHIALEPAYLQYLNHSCAPNLRFDLSALQLIVLSPVAPGDEFCFFYPSTEWKMAQPFRCHCKSPDCIGEVRGAYSLDQDLLNRHILSDHIHRQLTRRVNREKAV
ncbi:MAG: hypothetical protein RJA57_1020 [Bacteroidota bacterium]|jgi:hypothetical protein